MSTDSIEKIGIKDRTNDLEKSEENNDSNNGLQGKEELTSGN